MAFADVLKQLRLRDNMTQSELAEIIGVTKSAISMYEQGVREPNFETMEAIADTFNVPMDMLYGRDKETPPAPIDGREALRQAFIKAGIIHKDRDLTDEEFNLLIGAAKGLLKPNNE